MKKSILIALILGGVACSNMNEPEGVIGFTIKLNPIHDKKFNPDITVGGSESLNTISYSLSNGTNTYTGTANISSSTSFIVGNVAAGSGYNISLTGTTTDGMVTCTTASTTPSNFGVSSKTVTNVSVILDCKSPASDSGAVQVTINCNSLVCNGTSPAKTAGYSSNNTPTQWTTSNGFILYKKLNAFGWNYAPGGCDIVYAGQTDVWTFNVPNVTIKSANVIVSTVADDGSSSNLSQYSFTFWSGNCEFAGVGLPTGSPPGTIYTDWISASYPVNVTANSTYTVSFQNTSTGGGWFGVQWIELQIQTK